MKNSILVSTLLITLVLPLVFSISSCREPAPPRAVITVIDADKKVVAGAEVTIYVAENGPVYVDIDNEQQKIIATSDSNGQVTRDFKYEAIYNVIAKVLDKNGNVLKSGNGVLILEKGKTISETIIVR
jgi:hypothetical protein